jgi:hypothetical protein
MVDGGCAKVVGHLQGPAGLPFVDGDGRTNVLNEFTARLGSQVDVVSAPGKRSTTRHPNFRCQGVEWLARSSTLLPG